MRWLVVLLFLGMPVAAQAPSGLDVAIESHSFAYGPEQWKDGFPVDDQASFTAAAAGWGESLGTYLDIHVRAEPRTGSAQNDWEYHAWLTDGSTEVEGLVTPDPAGRFFARFDVDGQRALPGMAAVPALVPGTWTLRVRATTDDASGNPIPEGSGQTILETRALAGQEPTRSGEPIEAIRFPADLLPHVTELGPGAVWFNRAPHPSGIVAFFEVAGESIAWRAWWANAPARPDLGVGQTPVSLWQSTEPDTIDLPGRSIALFTSAPDIDRLFILSAVDTVHGGTQIWALGVSDASIAVTGVTAPEPGQEGGVTFDLQTPAAGPLRLAPGALHALDISEEGATAITSTLLLARGETEATGTLDGRSLRTHQGPYRAVAMLQDGGDYGGHATFDRGIDLSLDIPLLGAGTPTTMDVVLRSLSDDGRAERTPALTMRGTLRVEVGAETRAVSFEILEGGLITVPVSFTPPTAGVIGITVTMDTGDTYTLVTAVAPVLDAAAFKAETAPWYDPDKYVPGPPLVGLLLALVVLGRKR